LGSRLHRFRKQPFQLPQIAKALETLSRKSKRNHWAEIGTGLGLFPFPLEDVELEVLGLNWEESFDDKLVAGSVEII
jgi:hypothetical protein